MTDDPNPGAERCGASDGIAVCTLPPGHYSRSPHYDEATDCEWEDEWEGGLP